ncbi:MAG: D-2-hydroxyacid dehydrogenase [Opitutaceae bacterium]|nr:D-2-hydroxyacid dehydrogenase [Opitutaceae bacterium]
MKATIWCNHQFRPAAGAIFEAGLHGYELIKSPQATPAVLAQGVSDPALGEADVAYGQPDVDDAMRFPRLRWIELSSAGYTRYDREDFRAAMQQRGTMVTNASSVFAGPCAEHVLAMLLALNRGLPRWMREQLTERNWPYEEGRFTLDLLTGQTVVLLGFGAIGRRLAELLVPFRPRLIALRRQTVVGGRAGLEIVSEADLPRALAEADHVVNALPDNPATRGFVNAARFAQMKRGTRFYNIGRGTTVDQEALLVALQSGWLAAAYLDVVDPEPLPSCHPLWAIANCYITPHLGGGHREQDENMARHFLENLRRFERGEPLIDRII